MRKSLDERRLKIISELSWSMERVRGATLKKRPACVIYVLLTCGRKSLNWPLRKAMHMSHVEQDGNQSALQLLREEISMLKEQQIAAEKIAALVGMSPGDSEEYKQRHYRMKRLTRKLAVLDSEQGGHHEQEEEQEIAGQGAKNPEADRSG